MRQKTIGARGNSGRRLLAIGTAVVGREKIAEIGRNAIGLAEFGVTPEPNQFQGLPCGKP